MSSEAGGQEREAQRQLAESLGTPSYVDLTDEIARLEAALAASQERERQLREALLVAWKYTARAGLSNDQHNELDSIAGVVHAAYDEQVKP